MLRHLSCVYLHLSLRGLCVFICPWAQDHRPLAQAVHAQSPTSCWEAWRRTWLSTQSKVDSRLRHPGGYLGLALQRFGVWNGMTTSGVEQSFSKQCMIFRPERKHMGVTVEHDETVLTLDKSKDPKMRSTLLKGAQKVWLKCKYGMPRKWTQPRLDKGARRMQVPKRDTEKKWLHLARSKLSEALGKRKMHSADQLLRNGRVRVPEANWSCDHEKESLVQEAKRMKRKCEVGMSGGLLEDEGRGVHLHHFARQKDATRRTQVLNDARRDSVDVRLPHRICPRLKLKASLMGAVAAVEGNLVDVPAVTACAVQEYGMTVEQICLRATVCIVGDPARLPMRMQWVLALRGGVAVQPRFLETKGRRGAAVAYRPAIATPRQLWLSPRFMEKFPKIAVIIQSAAVDETSKWQLLVSHPVYKAARAKSSGTKKLLAVMVREEMTSGCPSELTGNQFLTWCQKVDASCSTLD